MAPETAASRLTSRQAPTVIEIVGASAAAPRCRLILASRIRPPPAASQLPAYRLQPRRRRLAWLTGSSGSATDTGRTAYLAGDLGIVLALAIVVAAGACVWLGRRLAPVRAGATG